jgi:hypothetical protein
MPFRLETALTLRRGRDLGIGLICPVHLGLDSGKYLKVPSLKGRDLGIGQGNHPLPGEHRHQHQEGTVLEHGPDDGPVAPHLPAPAESGSEQDGRDDQGDG